MKIFVLFLSLFPSLLLAGDFATMQEYQKMNPTQKVQVLKAYKIFVQEVLKNEKELEALTTSAFFSFINNAYASEKYNCFYGGWPSLRKSTMVEGKKRTFCTSPAKSNPQYKNLSKACGQGQLLCQPVLFGHSLCAEAATQAQRNSAFSQCQKKFEQNGKTLEELSKDILKDDLAPLADELFALVHDICQSGFQAKTGMCSNLKKRVDSIKNAKPSTLEVVDQGKKVEEEKLKTDLIGAVEKVDLVQTHTNEVNQKTTCTQCEQIKAQQFDDEVRAPYEASGLIDQNKSTAKDYCAGNQEGDDREKYSQGAFSDSDNEISMDITYQEKAKDKANRIVGGHDVRSERMGKAYSYIEEGVEYPNEEMPSMYPRRSYQSEFLGRGKEVLFEIVDSPVREEYENKKLKERFVSTDLRITQYSFFPRKKIPAIKKRDDKIIMQLSTGEEFIIDAKSGRVVSGVAKDLPPKNQTEVRPKNTRTYPDSDFSYQGDGLYIESKVTYSVDERSPGSVVPVKALVDGKMQECKLKSDDLWIKDYGYYLPQTHEKYLSSYWQCTRFKFEKDEELYEMIKKKCPTFKFPALTK